MIIIIVVYLPRYSYGIFPPLFLWYISPAISMVYFPRYFYGISAPLFLWNICPTISMVYLPRYFYGIFPALFLWYISPACSMVCLPQILASIKVNLAAYQLAAGPVFASSASAQVTCKYKGPKPVRVNWADLAGNPVSFSLTLLLLFYTVDCWQSQLYDPIQRAKGMYKWYSVVLGDITSCIPICRAYKQWDEQIIICIIPHLGYWSIICIIPHLGYWSIICIIPHLGYWSIICIIPHLGYWSKLAWHGYWRRLASWHINGERTQSHFYLPHRFNKLAKLEQSSFEYYILYI